MGVVSSSLTASTTHPILVRDIAPVMLKFDGRGLPSAPRKLLGPICRVDPAALDDGFHSSQRQDPSAMIRHDHLLPGCGIAPLLMTTGRAGKQESVTAENHNHLISG